MPMYTIREGSFRDADGSIKGPGQTIELDADMAAQYRDRVEPAADKSQAPAQPADEAAQ